MADRFPSAPRRHASADPIAPPRSRTASESVRRNLFQSRLARRPTEDDRAASAEPAPIPEAAPTRPSYLSHTVSLPSLPQPLHESASARVLGVITDEDDPFTSDDGPQYDSSLLGHEHLQESSGAHDTPVLDQLDELMGQVAPDEDEEVAREAKMEMEEEKQRLADAVKTFNKNSIPSQPEELLEAVRKSLRDKTAALADDNWMYEEEDMRSRQH